MRTALGDTTVFHVDDLIRISHGRDPMGNDHPGHPGDIVQSLLDLGLRFHIQSGSGVVQNQDGCLFGQGSGDADVYGEVE